MARLVRLNAATPTTYQLRTETVLGRDNLCDLALIADGVSRVHARIVRRDGGTFVLKDLDSQNGTFVNGKKLAEEYTLKAQDRVRIGSFLIRFEDETSDAEQSLPETGTWREEDGSQLSDVEATERGAYLTKKGARTVSERLKDD